MTSERSPIPDPESKSHFVPDEEKDKFQKELRASREKARLEAEKQERINRVAKEALERLNKSKPALEDKNKEPEQPNMFN